MDGTLFPRSREESFSGRFLLWLVFDTVLFSSKIAYGKKEEPSSFFRGVTAGKRLRSLIPE
jgi:hypothetical protein